MGVPAMPVVENFALMEIFENCDTRVNFTAALAGSAGFCFARSVAQHRIFTSRSEQHEAKHSYSPGQSLTAYVWTCDGDHGR